MTPRGWEEERTAAMPASYLERLSRRLTGVRSGSGCKGNREFWPDRAKLAISLSLQLEAGAQSTPLASRSVLETDLNYARRSAAWHEYGIKEGMPRLLDIFERRRIRVTSPMVGAAVDQHPELAVEVTERGHEAAVHSRTWTTRRSMTRDEERQCYEADIQSIVGSTGIRPVGFHAFWPPRSPSSLEILADLGFLYHMGDISRDEPFLVLAGGKPFAVVPNALDLYGAADCEARFFSSDQLAAELRNEFEMLYTESESRRRMMSISLHDWITGRPASAKVMEEFIIYAQRRPGVVFMRKDEIARFALNSAITPREGEPARDWQAA